MCVSTYIWVQIQKQKKNFIVTDKGKGLWGKGQQWGKHMGKLEDKDWHIVFCFVSLLVLKVDKGWELSPQGLTSLTFPEGRWGDTFYKHVLLLRQIGRAEGFSCICFILSCLSQNNSCSRASIFWDGIIYHRKPASTLESNSESPST